MYESFYGFSTRPFHTVPAKDRYFPAESIETARTNLIRCLDRAEGCGLVMGPTGSGISMLCEVIAEHFRGNAATRHDEAGEKRLAKKAESTTKAPLRAASGSARRSAVWFDAYSSTQ